MKNRLLGVAGAAATVVLVSGSIWAHHSGAMYDSEHPITFKGVVTEFAFINPHVQIHFEVKDEQGNSAIWIAGSAPPQRMYRAGWNKYTLKPGEAITVTGAPAKDGSKVMSVRRLVGPSGQVLSEGAE